MHDLNLACRYADHVIAMKDGGIVAEGTPADVIDATVVADVFGLQCEVVPDPICGTPMIVPRGRHHARAMTPELTAG
jgi:iron complex transport system ATP-binding protein